MLKLLALIKQGLATLVRRLRTNGLRPTFTWLHGQGIPKLTGIPAMKYSRVTSEIYVGPQFRKTGKEVLENMGINGSVNLRLEFDDAAHDLAMKSYCYIPVVDGDAPSLEQLNHGVAFIRQIIARGEKVYIHCHGGVGRAPTLATAYFISQGYTLAKAIELIGKARPFIDINPVQMEQLKRFEAIIGVKGQQGMLMDISQYALCS